MASSIARSASLPPELSNRSPNATPPSWAARALRCDHEADDVFQLVGDLDGASSSNPGDDQIEYGLSERSEARPQDREVQRRIRGGRA